jgi:hypothetical protein
LSVIERIFEEEVLMEDTHNACISRHSIRPSTADYGGIEEPDVQLLLQAEPKNGWAFSS